MPRQTVKWNENKDDSRKRHKNKFMLFVARERTHRGERGSRECRPISKCHLGSLEWNAGNVCTTFSVLLVGSCESREIKADNNECRPFCCRSHVTMRRSLIRMRFLRTQPRYSKLPSIIFNFNYIYAAPILLRVSFFLCFSFLFSPFAWGDESAARQKEISDWSPRERTTHLMRFFRDVQCAVIDADLKCMEIAAYTHRQIRATILIEQTHINQDKGKRLSLVGDPSRP